MATRKRDRIIALGIAMFFFLLASGLSIMVIVQAITSKHNQTNNSTPPPQPKNTMQGKQLQGFTPTSDVKALKITDTKTGDGAVAKAGDTVTVLYTGAVASTGTIFQSTQDTGKPATLNLNQVIKGWKDGIPGMKVGGTRQLLIPAGEAYGASPPQGSGIPPNAPLVFDITLLKVGN